MIHITDRRINRDDYEDDDFEREFRKERYDFENVRYCDCGRRMKRVYHETEVSGHWIIEDTWVCDVCD